MGGGKGSNPLRRFVAAPPAAACPLSLLRSQLPQRGSLWRAGQLSPEQAKLDLSEAAVLRCLGQRQLDKERCPEAAVPRKQGPPFCAISGLRRPVGSGPACQWLPLWGSWRAKARLRGQARHERTAHAAISRLFVRAILSPRPRITVSILALSVTCGDTSPKGRGFVRTGKVCKNCKNPLQTSPRCGIIHLAASPLRIEYLPL